MMMFLSSFIIMPLVALAVVIHYEMLRVLSGVIPKLRVFHRFKVVLGVFGMIFAHTVEIWLFGLAFYFMHHSGRFGSLEGNFDGSLLDCVYFSFTTYTSVGYGDIEPFGPLRFLSGVEAITGLSLIAWSASFMFLEMTKFWENGGTGKK